MEKELANVKNYLRIDPDLDAEDEILTELIRAAHSYISRSTGKKFIPDDELMSILTKLLVSHWYTNRNPANGRSNAQEYSHSITALLQHVEISDAYESDNL